MIVLAKKATCDSFLMASKQVSTFMSDSEETHVSIMQEMIYFLSLFTPLQYYFYEPSRFQNPIRD